MGTPEFAVASLETIRTSKHQLIAVVTVPDRPAGRGRKLQMSAVKCHCIEHNIPVLQPKNINDNAFAKQLHALRADVFVVVAFKLLPKLIFDIPKLGTFNCHASLLPKYRGAAPINWALINGETTTGVTTFFIDERVDTGAILEQSAIDIDQSDDAGSLHDKLKDLGSALVVSTLDHIADGTVQPSPQSSNSITSKAPKLTPENRRVNWSLGAQHIRNHIKGLSPYPCAWTTLTTKELKETIKISDVEIEFKEHHNPIGLLLCEKKRAKVAVVDGYIVLKKLQFQGKKMMTTLELINGSCLDSGSIFS